jgi:hypothetical protein
MENFDEPDLRKCIEDAVAERENQPYCGLATNAALMGIVMSLMKKRHKKNCPPMWLPVMKSMRAKAETVSEMSAEYKAFRFKPTVNLVPNDFHKANGYERCEDEAWRPASGREAFGFTVKDTYTHAGRTYNIWRKAPAAK